MRYALATLTAAVGVLLAALVVGANHQTRTVTVVASAVPAVQVLGAPVVVQINPRLEDHLTPFQKTLSGGAGCGTERAAVKHLTDGFALPPAPTVMTPDQLTSMAAPPVTPSSPRFPVEQQYVELRNVHVIAVKQEADSDLHVILTTATGAELNVEAPQAQCDASSPYAATLASARAAMDAAMPNVSTTGYTAVDLTATIDGVLFFDVLHGQRGAPNGVELHPVTLFTTAGTPPPPTTTAVTTTAPAPTTTGAKTPDADHLADATECSRVPSADSDRADDGRERC